MNRDSSWKPHIDGLRAVAVLAVLLYHAGLPGVSGGFVGVDVFFVISGFLISRIVFSDIAGNGRFSALRFYERRVRRLLPVFVVVTAFTLLAGYKFQMPYEFEDLGESALWSAGFAANVYFWLNSGYFSPAAETMPLLHYWSLGVEEQFYIVFPLAVLAVWRFAPRLLPAAIAVAAMASLALAEHAVRADPNTAFYLAPHRAWELLAGSLLALPGFPFARNRLVREIAGMAGLAMIVAAIILFDDGTAFPGLSAVLPVGGACLILWGCERGPTLAGRLLSLPPARLVGLWSYSIYMIHWPLIVFAGYAWPEGGIQLGLAIVAASVALGWLSYTFVEMPFRGRSMPVRAVFAGAASLSAVAAVGIFVISTNGFLDRLPPRSKELLAYSRYAYAEPYRKRTCFLDPDQHFEDIAPECLPEKAQVLLWGDSHAAHLRPGLDGHFARIAQTTLSNCAPMIGRHMPTRPQCLSFNDAVLEWAVKNRPDTVVLSAAWQGGVTLDYLDATVDRLTAARIPILLVGESIMYRDNVPVLLARSVMMGKEIAAAQDWITDRDVAINAELASRYAGNGMVTLVEPRAVMCGDPCPIAIDGEPLYFDRAHLTARGSRFLIEGILAP